MNPHFKDVQAASYMQKIHNDMSSTRMADRLDTLDRADVDRIGHNSSSSSSSSSSAAAAAATSSSSSSSSLEGSLDQDEAEASRSDHRAGNYIRNNSLPAFASDFSEYFFGAIIERSLRSWELHLTVFMMCHLSLTREARTTVGARKVHPEASHLWKRAAQAFGGVTYHPNGARKESAPFYCKISNHESGRVYIVRGDFVPNRLTTDSNVNKKLDIMRCRLEDSQQAYKYLVRSAEHVYIDIIRDNQPLINFTISWSAGKAGYMLSRLNQQSGIAMETSTLDHWKGYDPRLRETPGSHPDKVHLCSTGIKRLPSQEIMPILLEFVSHHLLIGIQHIYLPLSLGWRSDYMRRVARVLQSYISDGQVTLVSQSGDGIDMIQSSGEDTYLSTKYIHIFTWHNQKTFNSLTHIYRCIRQYISVPISVCISHTYDDTMHLIPFAGGLLWDRFAVKVLQSNMCLYQAKGIAEYVLLLDSDEFFIPKQPHASIADVLAAVEPDPANPIPVWPADVSSYDIKKTGNWTGKYIQAPNS
jgi:hypothetical protein